MGELAFFKSRNHLPEFVVRKLASVFFKDSLGCLGRWCVEQHDGRHVLSKRLCDAGELLSQHLHADAGMARREAELDQFPCTPFHVFRRSAVIEDDESVGAFERKTGNFQPFFNQILVANDDKKPRVSLGEPEESLVMGESRADEHDVIESAAEKGHRAS